LPYSFIITTTCTLSQSPTCFRALPPLVAKIVLPACKPPPSDSVPHRRSFVLTAADRSPRFADGSLVCSRSNNAVAAYLPSSPPACCRHIVGRRRIVTRRLQRPRSKATQCTKCTASYTHSGHCAALLSSLVAVCAARRGLLVIGCRRLLPRHRLDHKSHSTMFSHRAVFPCTDALRWPRAFGLCSDANGLSPAASSALRHRQTARPIAAANGLPFRRYLRALPSSNFKRLRRADS
jgi:hypothetical protein